MGWEWEGCMYLEQVYALKGSCSVSSIISIFSCHEGYAFKAFWLLANSLAVLCWISLGRILVQFTYYAILACCILISCTKLLKFRSYAYFTSFSPSKISCFHQFLFLYPIFEHCIFPFFPRLTRTRCIRLSRYLNFLFC